MLELEVVLDFACCECGKPNGVTVKCAGKTLGLGNNPIADFKALCPHCEGVNWVIFTPDDGNLIHVLADKPRYLIPKPSCN
jgi:hypothetical protein